jgi:hypothetical protein
MTYVSYFRGEGGGTNETLLRPPPLPRFPSQVSIDFDDEATRRMPPRAGRPQPSITTHVPRVPQRCIPTVRPPRRDARLSAVFYGLSAGVLLGAMLCFVGVLMPSSSPETAREPLLAGAGPSATPVAMRARIPGVKVEDLPKVLVRAEDLPLAPPLSTRRTER